MLGDDERRCLEQNSSHDGDQRKHHRRHDGRRGTNGDRSTLLGNARVRDGLQGAGSSGGRAGRRRRDEEVVGVLELELDILVGSTVAHSIQALGVVDAVALADQRLAAAVGVAVVAEVVLLLITEGRNVREVDRLLGRKERRGLVGSVRGRELQAEARVLEQVDTEVRVARANDLAVLLSDLVHVRRRGGTEVPVGHLAAVVGLVERTLDVLLTITEACDNNNPTRTQSHTIK